MSCQCTILGDTQITNTVLSFQNGILQGRRVRGGGVGGDDEWNVCLLRLEVKLNLFFFSVFVCFFKKGSLLGRITQLYKESLVQLIISWPSSVPELNRYL